MEFPAVLGAFLTNTFKFLTFFDRILTSLGPAPLHQCVGAFCCTNFRGFCRGCSWKTHCNRESRRQTKPKKGTKRKVQRNFAHFFLRILVFFLRKTSTIHISNFCSGMPLRKVHELTLLWFGLPGPLLIVCRALFPQNSEKSVRRHNRRLINKNQQKNRPAKNRPEHFPCFKPSFSTKSARTRKC